MAHGIARFSPKFCTDKMRFRTLGQSEAAFWQRKVFNIADPNTIPEQDGAHHRPKPSGQVSPPVVYELVHAFDDLPNMHLMAYASQAH